MNIPVLIVAIVMTFAILGHVIIGTRETATLEPKAARGKLMANWVQTMCAFQMLTLDLIVVTAVLYVIALRDVLPAEPQITLGLAAYFALHGLLWLGQVLWFARPGATILTLPHWAVWLALAVLLWVGA